MAQQQYDNTNRFVLFTNKNKDRTDPAHEKKPDYNGKINIDGTDYWLNAWLKTPTQGGAKFLSGTLGDPCDAPAQQRQQRRPAGNPADKSMGYQRPAQKPPPADPIQGEQQFKEDDIPF